MTDINKIAEAPAGHISALAGSNKIPVDDGSDGKYALISQIPTFLAGEGTMATVAYVDGIATNLGKRARVRAATTANITISTALNNADTLDGVSLATGDLVLVKDQSTASQNGVYVVGVTPARAAEFDSFNEHPGSLIVVEEGSTNDDTMWLCTSNPGGTLDSTSIAFSQVRYAAASTSAAGVVQLATVAEAGTGTNATKAVTPAGLFPATTDVASATTTDLGAVASKNIRITGTTTITSFGTAPAGISREGYFSGALILTHNSTSLILPGAGNITTAAGDAFEAISLGSGNWKVRSYTKANGQAVVASSGGGDMLAANNLSEVDPATAKVNLQIEAAQVDVASAATCNIGAAASENVRITGTTTITAFDTVASGVWRSGYFSGALTLTYNATSLILPGAANITTAAGDSFIARSLGSGNWKVLFYEKADGTPIAGGGGGGGTLLKACWSSDAPPASATSQDDEFDNGSLDGKWTEYDPNSVLTVNESSTYKHLLFTCTTRTGFNPTGIGETIPAGDFTIWAKFGFRVANIDYSICGLAFWEDIADVSKKIRVWGYSPRGSATRLAIYDYTNSTTFSAESSLVETDYNVNSMYFRIRRNSTNYYHGWSRDGLNWQESSAASNPSFTPTKMGLTLDNGNTGVTIGASIPFFRYIASDVGLNGIMAGQAAGIYQ